MRRRAMRKKRKYLFFVSPDPATETNQKLSHYLWQEGVITESQEMDRIPVGRKTVCGWIVDYSFITQLAKHIRANPFFKASYYEKEGDGQWRSCNLPYLRRKASVHSKKAQERLKEIGAKQR